MRRTVVMGADLSCFRHHRMRTCVRVSRGRRSSTPTSTRSTRRSSSATTRACAGGPVIVGGGVVLAASYEAKACGVRTAMGGRQARRLCPRGDRRPAADGGLLRGEQGGVRGVPRHDAAGRGALDRRGVPRRARAAADLGHAAGDRRAAAARACCEQVGLPITVGVARTKFLAKVASGVAKPDGLLVVPPDGELAFLHPLPVERLWGVGPVTAEKLHARGITTVGQVAQLAEATLVSVLGRASGRHLHALAHNRDPRPGAGRPPAALDRLAARARPRGDDRPRRSTRSLVGLVDRLDPPAARRPAGRPHGGAAPALRRLLARDALAHARRGDRADAGRSSPPARGLLAAAMPMIERQGLTLLGISLDEPRRRRRRPARAAVRRASARARSTRPLDGVRDRFGSAAITRAVLLGRDQGISVPLLPD